MSLLGVARVAVGHTPGEDARELCGGKLLAIDSSLSRPFRAFGNLYCPVPSSSGPTTSWVRGGAETVSKQTSSASNSGCDALFEDRCEGSIAKLERASLSEQWPRHAIIVGADSFARPRRSNAREL